MGTCMNSTQREQSNTESKLATPAQPQFNSLGQTNINQNDIKQMKDSIRSVNISNPFLIIIAPYNDEICSKSRTSTNEIAIISYKTHQDMKYGIRKTLSNRFYNNKHIFNGVIVMLKCVISVTKCGSKFAPQYCYDQNQQPKHIKNIEKDICYRLEDTPWILDWSKCTAFVSNINPVVRHYDANKSAIISNDKIDMQSLITVTQKWFNISFDQYNECKNKRTCDIDQKDDHEPDNIMEEKHSSFVTSVTKNQITKIEAEIDQQVYQEQYSSFNVPIKFSHSIPDKIKEQIPNVYNFIIKCMALQVGNEFDIDMSHKIKIVNCGFHDRYKEDEILYLIAVPFTLRKYKWQIIDRLFTSNDIKNLYSIITLSKSWRLQKRFHMHLNDREHIKDFLESNTNCQKLIKCTNWTKIPVYQKKANTKRITLSLGKLQFVQLIKHLLNDAGDIIPIIMPYKTTHLSHCVEFVKIIRIEKNFQIGICLVYEKCRKRVRVTGVHLDRWFLQNQHQLLCPDHICQCFDSFIPAQAYDHLVIGNPDKHKYNAIRIKKELHEIKQDCDEVKQDHNSVMLFIKNLHLYLQKMNSNPSNITVQNVQTLIDIISNVLKCNKNIDCSLDVDALLNTNEISGNGVTLSTEQIRNIMMINNFYFLQTLNPIPQPIAPHPVHKQTHTIFDATLTNVL
eukprot:158611_1